ncbi:hypothetical protein [Neoroseomonas terrae]|nr:hypothetical protein [Neoroseomonas terrae]
MTPMFAVLIVLGIAGALWIIARAVGDFLAELARWLDRRDDPRGR